MHQVTHVSKVYTFDALAPSIFVSTVWNLLYVTLLPPRIFRLLLDFWKVFVSLFIIMQQKQTGLFLYWWRMRTYLCWRFDCHIIQYVNNKQVVFVWRMVCHFSWGLQPWLSAQNWDVWLKLILLYWYLWQVVSIVLNFLLFVMALYDVIFSRRHGGDPTMPQGRDPMGEDATTYNNPGFRDRRVNNPAGISMTDASGKPYVHSPGSSRQNAANGSVASMTTTTSSNGSTSGSVTRSPLRSSLKKPRPRPEGMGIQNPGFSGHSPTLSRNGSMKKVRIQTHSTAVWNNSKLL